MVCRVLERALAGQVDEQPEGRLDNAPHEKEAAKGSMRGLGDAEGYPEYAKGCDGAEAEDDSPYEEVLRDGVLQHDGGCVRRLRN